MKQFSLKDYLKNPNRRVITRDGRSVRIICTDADAERRIVALVRSEGGERVCDYYDDGTRSDNSDSDWDLLFVTEKKEGWINILRNKYGEIIIPGIDICETKEAATEAAEKEERNFGSLVATIKIKWEE